MDAKAVSYLIAVLVIAGLPLFAIWWSLTAGLSDLFALAAAGATLLVLLALRLSWRMGLGSGWNSGFDQGYKAGVEAGHANGRELERSVMIGKLRFQRSTVVKST